MSFIDPLQTGPQHYAEYLLERGRTPQEIQDAVGGAIRLVSHREALFKLGYSTNNVRDGLYGLLIEYPDTKNYCTVRWLNPSAGKSKMLAPQSISPPCYNPPNLPEFTGDLYLCESAFKALTLTLEGYYAVAGNGVNGLFGRRGFADLFPTHIVEQAENVYILFDSDVASNPSVKRAMQMLGVGIENSFPHITVEQKVLPPPPDGEGHWGVDDFYAHYGKAEFNNYMEEKTTTVLPLELGQLGRHRLELNAKYAVSGFPAGIVDKDSGRLIKTTDFLNTLECNRRYTPVGKYNDLKPQSAAKEWMNWEHREYVKECRYVPGGPEQIENILFNKWRDSGVSPVEGDVSVWLEFLHNAIPRVAEANLLMQMYAYLLQNRGERSGKVVILISPDQSTGKSTIAKVLGKIFGKGNHVSIDPASFKGDFNSHYAEAELVQMDEVIRFSHGDMGRLERYVTDDNIDVNRKGWEAYQAPNHMSFILTSNRPDSIPLKPGERRAFVLEVTPEEYHPQGDPYWERLYKWLEDDEGYGKIRYWLQNMDLSEYNHGFLPPMNPMKEHMQAVGVDDWETFAIQLRDDTAEMLPEWVQGQMFFTSEQLEFIRQGGATVGESRWKQDVKTLAARLSKYFKQVNHGKPIRFKVNGVQKQARLWAITGPANTTSADVRRNLQDNWFELGSVADKF